MKIVTRKIDHFEKVTNIVTWKEVCKSPNLQQK